MSKKVLIIGVNGFIGSTLLETILRNKDWEIYGLDLHSNNIEHLKNSPRFTFKQGDMTLEKEWIESNLKSSDIVLPLAAIATPSTYVQAPLRIFELDFEANLDIVRLCVKYNKRVIFPSTSEVYGMCASQWAGMGCRRAVSGPCHLPNGKPARPIPPGRSISLTAGPASWRHGLWCRVHQPGARDAPTAPTAVE